MKRYLLWLMCAMLGVATMWAEKMPKAPSFLKPGDKIALLSMSSVPRNLATVDSAAAVLRAWGLVPVLGEHVKSNWHTYAGTPEERKTDIMKALRDPAIKAIMSTRGGYGAANVLALIPLDTLKKYDKWIIGYSDITAYLSAMVCAGHMSIHANMGGRLAATGGHDEQSAMLRNLLFGQVVGYSVPGHELNLVGTANGILVGGNLSVFGDLAGSPFDFLNERFMKEKDIILFFEDVGENFYKIDRMFQNMRLRGVLNKVKGIVVGRFSECPASLGYRDVNEMLHQYLAQYHVPVCYDFPTGHDEDWNYPLIEGCRVTLDVTKDKVSLQFNLKK